MKQVKLLFTLLMVTVLLQSVSAQTVGELDRFDETPTLKVINDVKLYPNPTVDYLSIRINNSTLEDVKFTVHNIIGNVIELEVEQISKSDYKIKVENLPSGYYLLAIKDKDNHFRETYKFLKR